MRTNCRRASNLSLCYDDVDRTNVLSHQGNGRMKEFWKECIIIFIKFSMIDDYDFPDLFHSNSQYCLPFLPASVIQES
jgi:hypothetical protein